MPKDTRYRSLYPSYRYPPPWRPRYVANVTMKSAYMSFWMGPKPCSLVHLATKLRSLVEFSSNHRVVTISTTLSANKHAHIAKTIREGTISEKAAYLALGTTGPLHLLSPGLETPLRSRPPLPGALCRVDMPGPTRYPSLEAASDGRCYCLDLVLHLGCAEEYKFGSLTIPCTRHQLQQGHCLGEQRL